ncbi:heterokaryon incompatibility protein-domain-containing protein [Hypoxylon cercidicola]|nr:heterokaryon incompatibility protein-domain-containing protein [Hypoxylon cercidicola]
MPPRTVVSDSQGEFSNFALSTGDPETLDLAKSWFNKCCESHDSCQVRTPANYPTRLLHIEGKDESIRLVLSSNLSPIYPPYATLSHCWGNAHHLKLLRDDEDDFLRDIPKSRLSKTYRDAIVVARHFGIEYLWIDSLCIIQDDTDDWLRESVKMADVYGCSSLNIAATGARDGAVGCFFERDERLIRSLRKVRIPFVHEGNVSISSDDDNDNTRFVNIVNSDIYDRGIENSPLVSRAWCFQERFLAPRTVHFAETQVFWECQEMNCCETFPDGVPPQYHPRQLRPIVERTTAPNRTHDVALRASMRASMSPSSLYMPHEFFLAGEHGEMYPILTLAEIWAQCVSMYSRTKLTRLSDKLVAISGVARWVHEQEASLCVDESSENERKEDEYLAGLWRKNLETQLLWRVLQPNAKRDKKPSKGLKQNKDNKYHYRPKEYLAPSWSWASTNGFVTYGVAFDAEAGNGDPSCTWTRHITVLKAETEPVSKEDGVYGGVIGGSLLVEFDKLYTDDIQIREEPQGLMGRIIDWDNAEQGYWAMMKTKTRVYLLPVISCCDRDASDLCFREGLVLKEISPPLRHGISSVFRRLGLIRTQGCVFKRLGHFRTQGCMTDIGRVLEDCKRFEFKADGKIRNCLKII